MSAAEDEKGPLPDGWRWAKLNDVCSIEANLVDPKLKVFSNLPHINGENIESGTCKLSNAKSADDDGMKSGKYLSSAQSANPGPHRAWDLTTL